MGRFFFSRVYRHASRDSLAFPTQLARKKPTKLSWKRLKFHARWCQIKLSCCVYCNYNFECAFTVNSLHISHFDMHAPTVSLSRLNIQTAYKYPINSLTTEKQTTKFSSANFQKMLSPSYIILRIQRLEGKQCGSR